MKPNGEVSWYARQKFGGSNPRPLITGVYAGAGGWTIPTLTMRLTVETAEELRASGVTMVRVRWRFRTHQIMLRRYLN